MKIRSLLLCGTVMLFAAKGAWADEPVAPAVALPDTGRVLAQDSNVPYTLQVVRAAWVKSSELKMYGEELGLTVWVRVVGGAGAAVPEAPLTLSDYVIDGRIGKPGDVFQMRGVGKTKVDSRMGHENGEVPSGLSVWRAQSGRSDWPIVRAEFEFLSPDAEKPKRLPPTILDGDLRESGVLRRFSVDIVGKDIELPAPPPKTEGVRTAEVGTTRFSVYPPVIKPKFRVEWAEYPGKRIWEQGDGTEVEVPVVVSRPRPNRRFNGGNGFKAILTSPQGQVWEINRSNWLELRPDGFPLKSDEEAFQLNALFPADADLKGTWTLNVVQIPAPTSTEHKTFANLALPMTVPVTTTINESTLAPNEWEVLDVRRFDDGHPLPATFGQTWRVGKSALLLRTRVEPGGDSSLNASVESVEDANKAQVLGRHDEIRLVGRETRARDGAQFLTYRVVLWPKEEIQGPLSLTLLLARSQTPPVQVAVPIVLP